MKTRNLAVLITRLIGLVNLFLAAFTLFGLAINLFAIVSGTFQDSPSEPFLIEAVSIMSVINLLFAAGFAIGGIWLIMLRPWAFRLCTVVYCAEIIYFLAFSILAFTGASWMSRPIRMSFAGATGVGNPFMFFQSVTGYPIIALVVLRFARKSALTA